MSQSSAVRGSPRPTARFRRDARGGGSPAGRAVLAHRPAHPPARADAHRHAGFGLHQVWDGPIEQIRSGDVVSVGPNEKHWHGASPTTAMTHLAIQEALDGKPVEWLEKVTDHQYEGRA
jgi:hypothetical protein